MLRTYHLGNEPQKIAAEMMEHVQVGDTLAMSWSCTHPECPEHTLAGEVGDKTTDGIFIYGIYLDGEYYSHAGAHITPDGKVKQMERVVNPFVVMVADIERKMDKAGKESGHKA